MKVRNSLILVRQIDKKLQAFSALKQATPPAKGWVHIIRTTLNMSLQQLGSRLSITPQSVKELELREEKGTVSLNSLREVAEALEMRLVYGFVPKEETLEKMIDQHARKLAIEIVKRTSTTMKLEDQENTPQRLQQAIDELTDEIKKEMPKYLWD